MLFLAVLQARTLAKYCARPNGPLGNQVRGQSLVTPALKAPILHLAELPFNCWEPSCIPDSGYLRRFEVDRCCKGSTFFFLLSVEKSQQSIDRSFANIFYCKECGERGPEAGMLISFLCVDLRCNHRMFAFAYYICIRLRCCEASVFQRLSCHKGLSRKVQQCKHTSFKKAGNATYVKQYRG